MYLRALFCAISISSTLLPYSHAWIFDAKCGAYIANITLAVEEAVNVAEYAAWRIANDPRVQPFQTQMISNLPGTTDTFINRMKGLQTLMSQPNSATFSSMADMYLDETVLIRCGDDSLVETQPGSNEWYDRDFVNRFAQFNMPLGMQRPCDGVYAFTAQTVQLPGQPLFKMPKTIIYWCPLGLQGRQVILGSGWQQPWSGIGVDIPMRNMAGTMFHELMHAVRGDNIQPDLQGSLPSGTVEAYDWLQIATLSDEDRQANAEGYTILAFAMWIKGYVIGNSGVFGVPLPPNLQAGNSPDDKHPT